MDAWEWLAAGLGLIIVEALTPGSFVAIFLGVASLLTGAAVAIGLCPLFWQQSVVASVLAVAGLLGFRRRLRGRPESPGSVAIDRIVGETATATTALPPHGSGHAEYRGTDWAATNAGALPIASGARCRIVRIEGLTLVLMAEEAN